MQYFLIDHTCVIYKQMYYMYFAYLKIDIKEYYNNGLFNKPAMFKPSHFTFHFLMNNGL